MIVISFPAITDLFERFGAAMVAAVAKELEDLYPGLELEAGDLVLDPPEGDSHYQMVPGDMLHAHFTLHVDLHMELKRHALQ